MRKKLFQGIATTGLILTWILAGRSASTSKVTRLESPLAHEAPVRAQRAPSALQPKRGRAPALEPVSRSAFSKATPAQERRSEERRYRDALHDALKEAEFSAEFLNALSPCLEGNSDAVAKDLISYLMLHQAQAQISEFQFVEARSHLLGHFQKLSKTALSHAVEKILVTVRNDDTSAGIRTGLYELISTWPETRTADLAVLIREDLRAYEARRALSLDFGQSMRESYYAPEALERYSRSALAAFARRSAAH